MTTPGHDVVLQPWHAAYPHFTIGGSIYAVAPARRAATAAALTANRCRVHADIIVDQRGRHRGVTCGELADVRTAAPGARLDLHLIVPAEIPVELAAEVLGDMGASARRFGVEAVTMNATQITRHRTVVDALREHGIQLWLEFSPGTEVRELPAGIDGATVMFITPGTKESADPSRLHEVTRLAGRVPTAVDGGITEPIAAQCVANGAGYVVAGRSLLTAAAPATHGRIHP
jgi:pentose-5-phosphate-3-epimerase